MKLNNKNEHKEDCRIDQILSAQYWATLTASMIAN